MPEFVEKYINPFTDYGFKRLFGEEPNKELLLDFLNELLKSEQGRIANLSYLNKLERVPNELRESIFERLLEVAEIAKFSKEEADAYENSLKSYRDLKNSLDTAYEEGMEKGEIIKNEG